MTDSTVQHSFTAEEMIELLNRAASRLIERCQTVYCEPAPPTRYLFAVDIGRPLASPPAQLDLLETPAAVRHLLRADGSFRDWVNVSPLGVAVDATVLALEYPDRFTTKLIVGDLAFPYEPFHLLGPDLSADYDPEGPPVKVALPLLSGRLVSS